MSIRKIFLTCLLAPLAVPPVAMADTPHDGMADAPEMVDTVDLSALGNTVPLEATTLVSLDGMADTSLFVLFNDNHQEAGITGNQLTSTMTGTNVLGQGIFSGSNGISTVIQNTGNQVLIQQTTQVNVLFQP